MTEKKILEAIINLVETTIEEVHLTSPDDICTYKDKSVSTIADVFMNLAEFYEDVEKGIQKAGSDYYTESLLCMLANYTLIARKKLPIDTVKLVDLLGFAENHCYPDSEYSVSEYVMDCFGKAKEYDIIKEDFDELCFGRAIAYYFVFGSNYTEAQIFGNDEKKQATIQVETQLTYIMRKLLIIPVITMYDTNGNLLPEFEKILKGDN